MLPAILSTSCIIAYNSANMRKKKGVLFSKEKTLTESYTAEQQPCDSICFTALIEQTGFAGTQLSG